MADLTFAKHTNAILNALPYWFKIRKDSKDSIGARFLNICGLELDDMRYVLDYAYKQCYISSCDIDQVDFCYKAIVPMPLILKEVKGVYANNTSLREAKTLKEFFGIDINVLKDKNLYSFESYYADVKRNIIYVRQKFNVDAINDNGKITLSFKDKDYTIPLIPHHVWNFFDEIGALVSCPRIFEEPNVEYKERILDVFRNKAGANLQGLINGIGRELALRVYVHWTNPSQDLELQDTMIVLNSIKLDGEFIPLKDIFLSSAGTVVIKKLNKIKHHHKYVVSYVHGLEMHQLFNKEDIKLYNELFTVEGKPKSKLLEYINILNSESPIFWNDFHWNEHYWNQNEKDVSGLGVIPHLYDGSINGFATYGTI